MRPEAASVIAALICSLLIPLFHIAMVRVSRQPESAIRYQFMSFGLAGMLWLGWCVYSYGFDPLALASGGAAIVFMMLGYMEAFSMLCRGFSLHIISDLHERGAMDIETIVETYGGGKGADWLMEKRIGSMAGLGLVRREPEGLVMGSWKGWAAGRLGLIVKRVLKMGQGG